MISAGYYSRVISIQNHENVQKGTRLTVARKVLAGPQYPKATTNMAAMIPRASDLFELPPLSKRAHVMHVVSVPATIRKYEMNLTGSG